MATLTVGPGKTFSTIAAAFPYVNAYDVILVEPGFYDEFLTLPNKPFSIIGNVSDPASYTEIVRVWIIYSYNYNSSVPVEYVFENLYFYFPAFYTPGNYSMSFYTRSCTNVSYLLNRCTFHHTVQDTSYFLYSYYSEKGILRLVNCRMIRTYSGHTDIYKPGGSQRVEFIKVVYTVLTQTTVNFAINDFAFPYGYGYGPEYGSRLINLPRKYKFSGRVTTDGSPSRNLIRAYRQDQHELVTYTYSDVSTGDFTLYTTYSGAHQLICDGVSSPRYNDKIMAMMVPASMTPSTVWDESNVLYGSFPNTGLTSDCYMLPLLVHFKDASGVNSYDTSVVLEELLEYRFRRRWSAWVKDLPYQTQAEFLYWDTTNNTGCAVVLFPYIPAASGTQLTIRYDRNVGDNISYISDTETDYTYALWRNNYVAVWQFNSAPTGGLIDSTFNKRSSTKAGTWTEANIVDGLSGKAWLFDGTNYVKTDPTAVHSYGTAGNWSVSAAVNFTTTSGLQSINNIGYRAGGLELGIKNGVLFASARAGTTYVTTVASGILPDAWYVVDATLSTATSTLSFYVDGVLRDSKVSGLFTSDYIKAMPYNYIGQAYTTMEPMGYLTAAPLASGTVLHVACSGIEGHPYIYDATGNFSFAKIGATGYITTQERKVGDTSYFVGSSDYFSATISGTLLNLGVNDFTCSFWINIKSIVSGYYAYPFAISTTATVDTTARFVFYNYSNATTMTLRMYKEVSGYINIDCGPTPLNRWTLITVVREDSLITVWQDGALISSTTYADGLYNAFNGGYVVIAGTNNGFSGYLDDIRFTMGQAIYPPTPQDIDMLKTGLKGKLDYLRYVGRTLSSTEVLLSSKAYKDNLFTFSS